VAIETELKKREAAGLLLLPDLSALANSTVGIFSDYSGEGPGSKRTDWIRHFDRRYPQRIRTDTIKDRMLLQDWNAKADSPSPCRD
jgi:hypothetical protein